MRRALRMRLTAALAMRSAARITAPYWLEIPFAKPCPSAAPAEWAAPTAPEPDEKGGDE